MKKLKSRNIIPNYVPLCSSNAHIIRSYVLLCALMFIALLRAITCYYVLLRTLTRLVALRHSRAHCITLCYSKTSDPDHESDCTTSLLLFYLSSWLFESGTIRFILKMLKEFGYIRNTSSSFKMSNLGPWKSNQTVTSLFLPRNAHYSYY